ncbi:hypothetical protein [Streptomyces sp. NPDC006638]|uniref:hypothetical protein n=1 Tax=Streptomyces sp. NPDC006638 TaxID=3157183 RepID=UPI0033AFDDF6
MTATVVVTAVLAGSAACGTVENLSAGQKLDRAFDKLGAERSLSFELDLDADAKTLQALDADAAPGEEMPEKVAELFSGATISLSVQSKKPLAESGEKDFTGVAMKVSSPEGDLLEYRVVGDYTYLRADVATLSGAMGTPAPPADELPEEAGALKKILEGEWVKVATKDLQQSAVKPGEPSAAPTLDATTQNKMVKALRGVIAREVEFKTAGEADGTEHVTATAPFRTLITGLFDGIRPLAKELPAGIEFPADKDFKDAPNVKVAADFALKNGALTEVSVDVAKLAENPKVKKLALVLRMSKGEKATAPAGATEVKLDELLESVVGSAAGGAAL